MAAKSKQLITINGQDYDHNSVEDSIVLQGALLPKGFRGDKNVAVRLFLNYRNMLQAQFDRHLLNNWPKIIRGGQVMVDDGEQPIIASGFGFEINLTADTVAAIGKTKMSGTIKFGSVGAAQAFDINQGDLFEDSASLDPTSDTSIASQREREEQEEREADEAKRIRDEEKAQKEKDKAEKETAGEDNVEKMPGASESPVEGTSPKAGKKKVAKKKKK